MTLRLCHSLRQPAVSIFCNHGWEDLRILLVGTLAVLEHLLVAIAWRIREVDAIVVVGIEIHEPSVGVEVETDASHGERRTALAHIYHVSLVGVYLGTLREHVVGSNIVDVLCLADGAQGLEVEP